MSIITSIPHFPKHSQGFCCRPAIGLLLSVGSRRLALPCPSAIVSPVADSLYNLRLVLHKKQLSVPTFRPVPCFRLQYHCDCQLTEIRFTHRPSTLQFSHLELRSHPPTFRTLAEQNKSRGHNPNSVPVRVYFGSPRTRQTKLPVSDHFPVPDALFGRPLPVYPRYI